jgi:hypothetical protein
MEMQVFVENGEYMEVMEACTCGMCRGTGVNVLATVPVEGEEYIEVQQAVEDCGHCGGSGIRILDN